METAPVAVIICAAGASSRMGGIKKEYQKLDNSAESLTVLGSSVCAFASVPSIGVVVIAVPENGENSARSALPPLHAQKPKIVFVNGGKTRRASVFNALSCLAAYKPQYVLIHDGARPWVTCSIIEKIIDTVEKHGAVIPLLPLTDTPKEIEPQAAFIKNHLKRANTGIAQTPQGFKFPEILHAHEKAAQADDEEFTDDAEIWGRFCGKVAVIPGDPQNRKITYMEDLG